MLQRRVSRLGRPGRQRKRDEAPPSPGCHGAGIVFVAPAGAEEEVAGAGACGDADDEARGGAPVFVSGVFSL